MATRAQAAGIKFELTGVAQLVNALEKLPTVSMQRSALRGSLKKALKPTQVAAQASAPRVMGNLADSIRITSALKKWQKKKVRRDKTKVEMFVGSSAPHAYLVEFGTSARSRKKSNIAAVDGEVFRVQDTGTMPPNPFLRKAWDASKGTALKIFSKEMKKRIEKSINLLREKKAAGTLTKQQQAGWTSAIDDFEGFD